MRATTVTVIFCLAASIVRASHHLYKEIISESCQSYLCSNNFMEPICDCKVSQEGTIPGCSLQQYNEVLAILRNTAKTVSPGCLSQMTAAEENGASHGNTKEQNFAKGKPMRWLSRKERKLMRQKRAEVRYFKERKMVHSKKELDKKFLEKLARRKKQKEENKKKKDREGKRTRVKRSSIVGTPQSGLMDTSETRKTWTLGTTFTDTLGILTATKQKDEITLAFREWASKSNLCFDYVSSSADINIDFLSGSHSTSHSSGSFGSTSSNAGIAHSVEHDRIHLNDAVFWKVSADTATTTSSAVLQTVMLHEIGHVLGVAHQGSGDVMNSSYSQYEDPSYLDTGIMADLASSSSGYGKCVGEFDVMIDTLWLESTTVWYRTMIIRDYDLWQYSNVELRAIDGMPWEVKDEFSLETSALVYGILQAYDWSAQKFSDVYVFRASTHTRYHDGATFSVSSTATTTTSTFQFLPTSIDSVYWDTRAERAIFFKGATIYLYSYSWTTGDFTYEGYSDVCTYFPKKSGEPTANYCTVVSAAYNQVATGRMYIVYLEHVWENEDFYNGLTTNSMVYKGEKKDLSFWKYICEDTCP